MNRDDNRPPQFGGAQQQQPQGIQIQVPVFLPLSDDGDFFITPTFLQLIIGMEVLPLIEGVDYFTHQIPAGGNPNGTLKVGVVRLKLMLASGRDVELDPNQADTFLTMIGTRQRLVEVPSIQM